MKRLGDEDWHADVTDSLMRSADDAGFFRRNCPLEGTLAVFQVFSMLNND